MIGKILLGAVGLVALMVGGGSFYQVDQSEVGVKTRFGAVVGTVQPGFGWKMPFIEGVNRISTQVVPAEYDTEVYTSDQQPVKLKVSVNYAVSAKDAVDIFVNYGGNYGAKERIMDRRIENAIKIVYGKYNAVKSVQNRTQLVQDITALLREEVAPLTVVSFQLEDDAFTPEYEASVEQRMQAEVEVQKSEQQAKNAEQLAKKTVTEAQAQADSNLAKAKASAEAVRIQGEAEAAAIKARAQALKEAGSTYVDLVKAEKWNGTLPTTIPPNGTVPFMNLNTEIVKNGDSLSKVDPIHTFK